MSDRGRISFSLNGRPVAWSGAPLRRLSRVLREDLGLTGTKVGCEAGDCGACTVLVDDQPVCACLTPVVRLAGRRVETVEGLGTCGSSPLQRAFHALGATQCGICAPGMLMAATALLRRCPQPTEAEVMDALGLVLCRCTGYRKIIAAVMAAHRFADGATPDLAAAPGGQGQGGEVAGERSLVGQRRPRVDGLSKLDGSARYGDDVAPPAALWLRLIRSPCASARFVLGAFEPLFRRHPGLVRVLTAADVPGSNVFGVIGEFRDQPVFATGIVRYQGEPVAAVVGDAETIERWDDGEFPVTWTPEPAVSSTDAALASDAPQLFAHRPGNILTGGRVVHGDLGAAFERAAAEVSGTFETGFVEHAYIEPEAGFAQRRGETVEIHVSTQTPYMDRDDTARILGLSPEQVRVVPTHCGGGFGGKLDLSVQPYLALAAWLTGRPVRLAYSRPESMACTTKRHPARITARLGADGDGRLLALDFHADFNTGAYASWGPTVANRVPVHATGPYRIPAVRAQTRAIHTHLVPAGAFRGFGTPQAAIATEGLMDELADRLGLDRLAFRLKNALVAGDRTPTGQTLTASVGMVACLKALQPHWATLRADSHAFNRNQRGALRRGVGVAGMWYGCGNTALPNPSTMRVGIRGDGTAVLFQGAVDVGQGANTVLAQICAEALGWPLERLTLVNADTHLTADAGKTSASRQTFISGQATAMAARELRRQLIHLAGAAEPSTLTIAGSVVTLTSTDGTRTLDLAGLVANPAGLVLQAEATFDAPTAPLDQDGQGVPYATYAFGAQLAVVEVDTELGTVKVVRMVAAHDVGRAINPTLVEGQVEGGIAQGIGMALLEEYRPGQTETLHDYLIPTIGDVPSIEVILIEDPEPLGPFGAKGVGEPALIPTAAAILNAIRDATGVAIRRVPVTPDRLRAALHPATSAPLGPRHG